MGYSLCKMADFQNCLISRIFSVFFSGLLHRTVVTFLGNLFLRVFGIFKPKVTIFQTLYPLHAWAIAFARWPIFKIVNVFPYLVFFQALFYTEQL